MLLTETLESVTPEESRHAAASNNRNFLYNMLIQMKRIELNDRNLETLQEMDVEQVDSVSAHSDTPDENEYQSSSAFADVGAFLYVATTSKINRVKSPKTQTSISHHCRMFSTLCDLSVILTSKFET